MLKPQCATMPGHIQAVFVQNILKLYAFIRKKGVDEVSGWAVNTTIKVGYVWVLAGVVCGIDLFWMESRFDYIMSDCLSICLSVCLSVVLAHLLSIVCLYVWPQEDTDEADEVLQLLDDKLVMYVQASDLEVQERGCAAVQLLKYMRRLEEKGKHYAVKEMVQMCNVEHGLSVDSMLKYHAHNPIRSVMDGMLCLLCLILPCLLGCWCIGQLGEEGSLQFDVCACVCMCVCVWLCLTNSIALPSSSTYGGVTAVPLRCPCLLTVSPVFCPVSLSLCIRHWCHRRIFLAFWRWNESRCTESTEESTCARRVSLGWEWVSVSVCLCMNLAQCLAFHNHTSGIPTDRESLRKFWFITLRTTVECNNY